MSLLNPCNYSFKNLFKAANEQMPTNFYNLSRNEINNKVKELCKKANWFYEDKVHENITYTAFSPHKKSNN